nr:hypothetical protein [Planctomycetota bacterium]
MATKPDTPEPETDAANRPERQVPLAAVLSSLAGLGLMLVFWQRRGDFRAWHDALELAFVTGASFLLVWGLTELIGAIFFRTSKSDARMSVAGPPRLGTASWLGAVLLSLGAGGMLLVPLNSTFGFLPVSLMIVGAGLLFYGGKRFVDRLLKRRDTPSITQGVALTRPGAACLVIAGLL